VSDSPSRSSVPNVKLLFTLIALAGVIIVGIAAYIFTHLSGIDLKQSIILIAFGIIGLVLITIVLAILLRALSPKK
jgi:hypothetical protein